MKIIELKLFMPYQNIDELTDKVKDNLPRHAQEIFKGAFNSAYDQYYEDEKKANKLPGVLLRENIKRMITAIGLKNNI